MYKKYMISALPFWFSTKNPPYTADWELYNLKEDIGETINLAKKELQIVQNLGNKLNKRRELTGAKMPVRNMEFKGK